MEIQLELATCEVYIDRIIADNCWHQDTQSLPVIFRFLLIGSSLFASNSMDVLVMLDLDSYFLQSEDEHGG